LLSALRGSWMSHFWLAINFSYWEVIANRGNY
jgi:hypothetical protein